MRGRAGMCVCVPVRTCMYVHACACACACLCLRVRACCLPAVHLLTCFAVCTCGSGGTSFSSSDTALPARSMSVTHHHVNSDSELAVSNGCFCIVLTACENNPFRVRLTRCWELDLQVGQRKTPPYHWLKAGSRELSIHAHQLIIRGLGDIAAVLLGMRSGAGIDEAVSTSLARALHLRRH
jgi:hypothetical protein